MPSCNLLACLRLSLDDTSSVISCGCPRGVVSGIVVFVVVVVVAVGVVVVVDCCDEVVCFCR